MDTSARGRRKKRGTSNQPGTFRPSVPGDTFDVMRIFAIAARAVCVLPENLDAVSARLGMISGRLVAPESNAAQECLRLWKLFARVAQLPKESLRIEAGRAFCRDLDTLGQRLDLPPLADWEELPDELDEPGAPELEVPVASGDAVTLALVKGQARAVFGPEAQGKHAFPAGETAKLVSSLNNNDRRQLFEELVGKGLLGRSDVNLLIRFLVKGDELESTDTMLVEVLDRLGRWLAQ